ncbi:MAG: trimethylamine methyltransferase family protein, partial [Eubacteriales bacterium]|nr:trimethylamine methyltransferase family protein [Eubacteriales bacterium]
LKHLQKGIRFNEETLATDLLMKVGSGGSFMSEKHTLKNYKKEQYYGNIVMNYQERAAWKKEGGKTIFEKAKDYIEEVKTKPVLGLNQVQSQALDKAFIEVCLDSGLTLEKAEELMKIYNEA